MAFDAFGETGGREASGGQNPFVVHERVFSKYSAKIAVSSDGGRTFYELSTTAFCPSCAEKTVICPHRLCAGESELVQLPPGSTHLKLIRPAVAINREHIECAPPLQLFSSLRFYRSLPFSSLSLACNRISFFEVRCSIIDVDRVPSRPASAWHRNMVGLPSLRGASEEPGANEGTPARTERTGTDELPSDEADSEALTRVRTPTVVLSSVVSKLLYSLLCHLLLRLSHSYSH